MFGIISWSLIKSVNLHPLNEEGVWPVRARQGELVPRDGTAIRTKNDRKVKLCSRIVKPHENALDDRKAISSLQIFVFNAIAILHAIRQVATY